VDYCGLGVTQGDIDVSCDLDLVNISICRQKRVGDMYGKLRKPGNKFRNKYNTYKLIVIVEHTVERFY
jgi:hypothetical protein